MTIIIVMIIIIIMIMIIHIIILCAPRPAATLLHRGSPPGPSRAAGSLVIQT